MTTDEKGLTVVEGQFIELGTIHADSPKDLVRRATEIAEALADVIDKRQLYKAIQGKKYVMVEGWSTLGGMIGVLPREVSVARLPDGGYEASVELVRVSDGMIVGRASAVCGMDEDTWAQRKEYARRSMAVTRATGKAYRLGFSWIIKLAGYEATPAEEMPAEEHEQAPNIVPPANKPSDLSRPYAPETLRKGLRAQAAKLPVTSEVSNQQRGLMAGMAEEAFAGEGATEKRHSVLRYLWDKPSALEMTGNEVIATLDWLKPSKDSGGAYHVSDIVLSEIRAVLTAALKEAGQQELIP